MNCGVPKGITSRAILGKLMKANGWFMGPLYLVVFIGMAGCAEYSERTLPILGEPQVDPLTGETTPFIGPDFSFLNQDNEWITQEHVEGKIQVVDFFFASCVTICPIMTRSMVKVQEAFPEDPRLALLSYTIDPAHDTPERLAEYADRYGIDNQQWSLLTGKGEEVFSVSKGYKVMAFDDSLGETPNLIHDGTFVLLDTQRRVRGYYNGLEPTEIDRLIDDIELLLTTL